MTRKTPKTAASSRSDCSPKPASTPRNGSLQRQAARVTEGKARHYISAAARVAIFARLERPVDPDGTLSPEHRALLIKRAARKLSAELNAARARKQMPARHPYRHSAT